jgi:enamine deaminase RidA (YjgF/YER057c/UK114 family)
MTDGWTPGRRCVSTALLLLLAATAAPAQEPRFLSPPGLPPTKGYTHVVDVPAGHRLIFLSGQLPLDSTGALRGASDFRTQARQVFENLRVGLAAAGADFGDVVKLNFYVLDVRNVPALREVRDRYVNLAAPPASTLVQVSRLPWDDVLLEVEAIAAVPEERGGGGARGR